MIGICQSTPNFGYYVLDLLLFGLEMADNDWVEEHHIYFWNIIFTLYLHRLPVPWVKTVSILFQNLKE